MRRPLSKRKCQHCKTFFEPDPRSAGRQHYCATPACRKASKAASQRRWLHQPRNRDYFSGPVHVERVRQWRQAHPGYWRRQAARVSDALQEPSTPQEPIAQQLDAGCRQEALQDAFFMQPPLFVGLIAHLTGLSLQEDIAVTARRLQQPGNRDYFSGPAHVERVRQWRQAHPGDWRRKASRVPEALQESLTPQETIEQQVDDGVGQDALQDAFFMQPTLFVGLLAHLTGLS